MNLKNCNQQELADILKELSVLEAEKAERDARAEAERLAQARNRLEEEIMTAFDSELRGETQCPVEGYRPITDTGHPYALFTDREGNLVLSIRVYMQGSKNPRLEWVPVLMYAVMNQEK